MSAPHKIIHLADTHLFFAKKFEAHEYVFNQFYKEIESIKPDLIVSCGDLIDSKAKLSPEQFHLARTFLLNLTSYCPVIIILGNHDLNLKAKDRLDSISPIVHSLYNETVHPIHFFKHSGLYELYDIQWAVWSCLDGQKKPFEDPYNGNQQMYTIGLYHGVVKGCISDNGMVLSDGIDVEEFKECNRVFLGDVHAQQFFRNKEIAFSGSTIQTKTSEPAKGSYIVWEWNGKDYVPTVNRLGNIYSTVTLDATDVDVSEIESDKQHIVLKYDSAVHTKTEIIKIKKELQAKVGNSIEIKKAVKKTSTHTAATKKGQKIDLQNALATYLKELKLEQDDVDKILALDEFYDANTDSSKDFELGDFALKSLELKNFLAFKPDVQTINFDKEGIIGIGGKNRVGKSSAIRAIMFCLYNSSPDSNASLKKLINKHNRSKEAHVALTLEKNGELYKITRRLIPKKKEGVTTELVFQVVDENGRETKNLTGEKRQETEKEIQKYFGTESTFEILSLYSAQKRQQEFIDCKNSERLLLINRFIGLQNYETKVKEAAEDLKSEKSVYQAILKDFNQSTDLAQLESELNTLLANETHTKSDIIDAQDETRIYAFKHRHLVSNYELNKKLASKFVTHPEEAQRESKKLENHIATLEEYKIEINQAMLEFQMQKNSLSAWFKELHKEDISKYKINYRENKAKEDKLAILHYKMKELYAQLQTDVCNNCGKSFTEEEQDKVRAELSLYEGEINITEIIIDEFNKKIKEIEAAQDEYADFKDKIEQCETELKKVDNDIKNTRVKIENVHLKTKDWDEVQAAKERLEELDKEYQKFHSNQKESSKTLDMLQNQLGATRTKTKLLQKEIETYKTQYAKLQESEEKMRLLKLYKDVINKDGLPLFILKSKLDDINEQVNAVVSQVFDFKVEFSIDTDSGELHVEFFYDGDTEKNDVGFASGSETFIINLCLKVGLSQVSELPKLTSLLIDEGYGTLDKESIERIPNLFEALPEYYTNVITVSHIDELKDLYQHEIELEKVGKYTEIVA